MQVQLVSRVVHAVQFEPLAKALEATLGTKKVFKKSVDLQGGPVTFFYAKGTNGKATKFASVEKGIYPPDCTHTWVIGIDAKSSKITGIRVVEMSCHHAHPTRSPSFLDQFKGKGPADAATLEGSVDTVAKATGSSELAAKAVVRSIQAHQKIRGKI